MPISNLLHEREAFEVLRHAHHDPVFDVEQDLLLLSPVADEGVQRVSVRRPADQLGSHLGNEAFVW